MKKFENNTKGITLVALVVTIIVLLILAGVSIGTLFDSDGLFKRANDVAAKWNQSKENEFWDLENAMNEFDKYNVIHGGEQEKEEGILTLSDTSGTIKYPHTGEFTIIEHTSDGELSVSSSDDSIASASITGDTVTIISKAIEESKEEVTITVTSKETERYKEQTADYIATIESGTITINATFNTTKYTGVPQEAITSLTVEPEDATLTYSLNGGEYTSQRPKVTEVGQYSVSIKAVKQGYTTCEVTETVTVSKQENTTGNLELSEASGVVSYPNTKEFTIINNASNGNLKVESSDTSVATATITGNTVTINSQAVTSSGRQAVITVTSEETESYKAQTATYTITVNQGTISISATGYSGIEDGSSHPAVLGVSTSPSDCTKTYSINNGSYTLSVPYISSVGTYTINIQASKAGYKTTTITRTARITEVSPPNISRYDFDSEYTRYGNSTLGVWIDKSINVKWIRAQQYDNIDSGELITTPTTIGSGSKNYYDLLSGGLQTGSYTWYCGICIDYGGKEVVWKYTLSLGLYTTSGERDFRLESMSVSRYK